MAKKGKAKTFLVVLSTLLVVAATGAAAWGVAELLGYGTSVSLDNYFDDLEIATEQYANYTAAAVEPTLDLPDGYTYKIESIQDAEGNEVESAIELGTYTFKVRVIYRASSRTYEITLTIRDGTSLSVENNKNSSLLKISKQLLTSGTDDSGYEYQEVSYEVNGTLSASAVEGSLAWAETTAKVMSEYMTFSIDTTAQTVRLTCLQAFDTQIIFTLSSTELNTATASLTIDYQEKMLSDIVTTIEKNSIEYNSSSLITISDNDILCIKNQDPIFSIGTIAYSNEYYIFNNDINIYYDTTIDVSTILDKISTYNTYTKVTFAIDTEETNVLDYGLDLSFSSTRTAVQSIVRNNIKAILNWYLSEIATSTLVFDYSELSSYFVYSTYTGSALVGGEQTFSNSDFLYSYLSQLNNTVFQIRPIYINSTTQSEVDDVYGFHTRFDLTGLAEGEVSLEDSNIIF